MVGDGTLNGGDLSVITYTAKIDLTLGRGRHSGGSADSTEIHT